MEGKGAPSSSSSPSKKNQTKKVYKKKETTRNWLELPRDVMALILKRLGAVEILETAQKVCMLWRSLCKVPSMWRAIDMCNSCCRRSLGDPNNMRYYLEKMCIHAIDQSQFRPAARCPHQELWLRRAPHLHCPEVLFFFPYIDW